MGRAARFAVTRVKGTKQTKGTKHEATKTGTRIKTPQAQFRAFLAKLASADDLDKPAVKRLIRGALTLADVAVKKSAARWMVIKSVSAKQRARTSPSPPRNLTYNRPS